jgi:hypothetical protein
MAQINAKLIGTGTPNDPFRVNLPNYNMIGEPNYTTKKVDIKVPDDELTSDKTRPDVQKIRNKYKGQTAWDRANVASDV